MAAVESRHNEDQSRYEGWVDGELAGFAAYQRDDGRITFTHTEVGDAYEGHGVGSAIARFALDDVRAQGGPRVVPQCRFIRDWIDRHPDYRSVLHGP
jgi:hypothetical protein